MRYVVLGQRDDPRTEEAYVDVVGSTGEGLPSREALFSLAGPVHCGREFCERAGECYVFSIGQPRNRLANPSNGYRGDTRLSVPMIGYLWLDTGDESNWQERVNSLREKYGQFRQPQSELPQSPRRDAPPKTNRPSTPTPVRKTAAVEQKKASASAVWRPPSGSSRWLRSWLFAVMLLGGGILSAFCIYLKAELSEKGEIERELKKALSDKSTRREILISQEVFFQQRREAQSKQQMEDLRSELRSELQGVKEALEKLSSDLREGRPTGRAK